MCFHLRSYVNVLVSFIQFPPCILYASSLLLSSLLLLLFVRCGDGVFASKCSSAVGDDDVCVYNYEMETNPKMLEKHLQ